MSTGIFKLIESNQPENRFSARNYVIYIVNNSLMRPNSKDSKSCADVGTAEQPDNTRAIAVKILDTRKDVLGSLVIAAGVLGFNKNTIDSYERGKTLPDIDYLVVFADKTGTDLNELIRLRLAASRYPTVRALVAPVVAVKPAPAQEEPPAKSPGEVEFQRGKDWSMLEALLRICEDRLGREVSSETLDKISDIVKSWESATDLRPDLVARMERVKAGVALLRCE